MKKFVEPDVPNLVGENKFANLQDDSRSGSEAEE